MHNLYCRPTQSSPQRHVHYAILYAHSLSHRGGHTHTYTQVQLGCFSKGCLCKGSWILKLAAYFTFMKVGNGPTADMITPRSKQEKALTFSYGSHYPFSTSLSLSVYLYLFFYHHLTTPLRHSLTFSPSFS